MNTFLPLTLIFFCLYLTGNCTAQRDIDDSDEKKNAALKEYQLALEASKKLDKPILLYFTVYAVINVIKMEEFVLQDATISTAMHDDFILLELYVDDRMELPEEEWITDPQTNEVLRTIGQQNMYLERTLFKKSTQPFFAVLDGSERIYGATGFVEKIDYFQKFLRESLQRFDQ